MEEVDQSSRLQKVPDVLEDNSGGLFEQSLVSLGQRPLKLEIQELKQDLKVAALF
jgi:hypothetical protein